MQAKPDPWRILTRIGENAGEFAACETTVGLAVLLIVRSNLVQGVRSEAALRRLAELIGQETLLEAVQQLAGYEAIRIVANIDGAAPPGPNAQTAARRRLMEMIGAPPAQQPVQGEQGEPGVRLLQRHRALGARRRVGIDH